MICVCPFFLLTNTWRVHSFCLSLPLFSSHRLSPKPPVSRSENSLHARMVAEGAGEVIQSRISPSHPTSWYSYHSFAPPRLPAWIPTHWRRLSTVISTLPLSCSLLCSHFSIFSPPLLLLFLPVSCSFSFMSAFFLSHLHVSPPSVFFSWALW